jgi:hypothetical protein
VPWGSGSKAPRILKLGRRWSRGLIYSLIQNMHVSIFVGNLELFAPSNSSSVLRRDCDHNTKPHRWIYWLERNVRELVEQSSQVMCIHGPVEGHSHCIKSLASLRDNAEIPSHTQHVIGGQRVFFKSLMF